MTTLRPIVIGTFEIVVGAVVLSVVAFQAWLTVRVMRNRTYERKQKIWQTQLIWLVPVLGAGLVFTMLQEEERSQRPTSSLNS